MKRKVIVDLESQIQKDQPQGRNRLHHSPMSCSICRLPFVPEPISINPTRQPLSGVLTPNQYKYFEGVVGFGNKIANNVNQFEYFSENMFDAKAPLSGQTVVWESQGGTVS